MQPILQTSLLEKTNLVHVSTLDEIFYPMIQKIEERIGDQKSCYVEPCVCEVREDGKDFYLLSESIELFLNTPYCPSMLLTGYAKSGMSFATQMYTLDQWNAPTSNYLVFYVPLDQIKEGHFTELMKNAFALYGIDIAYNLALCNRIISQKVLFIFDGYDHIHFKPDELNIPICYTNYLKEWPEAKFLFTCNRSFYKEKLNGKTRVFEAYSGSCHKSFLFPMVSHLLPFQYQQTLEYIDKKCQALAFNSDIIHNKHLFWKRRIYDKKSLEECAFGLKTLIVSIYTSIFNQAVIFNPFLEADKPNPRREIKHIRFSALSNPLKLSAFIERIIEEYEEWKNPISIKSDKRFQFFKDFEKVTRFGLSGCGWLKSDQSPFIYRFFKEKCHVIKTLLADTKDTENLNNNFEIVCNSLEHFVVPKTLLNHKDYTCFHKIKVESEEPFTDSECTIIQTYAMLTEQEQQEALKDPQIKTLIERFEQVKHQFE